MKNTIKDLLESYQLKEGVINDIAAPVVVREIKNFARAINGALQHSIPNLFSVIERELGNFSLTLGDLDSFDTNEDEGEEDLILFHVVSGEPIKNIFISISYEKVSPVVVPYQEKPLNYRVKMKVNQIDPKTFDDMVNTGEVVVDSDLEVTGDDMTGDDDYDDFEESTEQLEESKKQYFETGGEYYKIVKVAKSAKEANDYCEKHDDCGVIGQSPKRGTPKEVYIAKLSDKGVKKAPNGSEILTENLEESKDYSKMSDFMLKVELKKARDKDSKEYEKIVNEFEKRGLKESVLSKARLRSHPNITVTLQGNTLRAQIKNTKTDIELTTKEDKKKLFTIFNLYDPKSNDSKIWLKKHFTSKQIKEYENMLEYILSHVSESIQESISQFGKKLTTIKMNHGTVVTVYEKDTPYDALYKKEWNFVQNSGHYILRALSKETYKKALNVIDDYNKKAVNKDDEEAYLSSLKNDRRLN